MADVPGFRLEADVVAEGLHRVKLSGEVDFTCADALAQSLLFFNGTCLEVDVSDVTFIDAEVVGVLLDVKATLESQRCELYVTGAWGIVREILAIVGPAAWTGRVRDDECH